MTREPASCRFGCSAGGSDDLRRYIACPQLAMATNQQNSAVAAVRWPHRSHPTSPADHGAHLIFRGLWWRGANWHQAMRGLSCGVIRIQAAAAASERQRGVDR